MQNVTITSFIYTSQYDLRDVKDGLDFAVGCLLDGVREDAERKAEVVDSGIIGRTQRLEPTKLDLEVLDQAIRRRYNPWSKMDVRSQHVIKMFEVLKPRLS